jgi:hypothetical protein
MTNDGKTLSRLAILACVCAMFVLSVSMLSGADASLFMDAAR